MRRCAPKTTPVAEDLEARVRRHFRSQAEGCRRLGSPFTGAVLEAAADKLRWGDPVSDRILGWDGDVKWDALGLRVTGALHAIALMEADAEIARLYSGPPSEADVSWDWVGPALTAQAGLIDRWLDSPPQTNEVARAFSLTAGLGEIARRCGPRLALYEIGSSAGLNLTLDRFAYEAPGRVWGDPASAVRLAPEIEGAPPPTPPSFEIIARAGCDRAPVDLRDPEALLRLRSYCWPDQPYRLERLDAAVAIALDARTEVAHADAADWVEAHIPTRPAGAVSVLMHSIMWQYLPAKSQARIEALLTREGAADPNRPLAWLRLEDFGVPKAAVLRLTLWTPAGERTADLAEVDYHGRWIRWRA